MKSCGSSSIDVFRRNVPVRVRRSTPSTPPGARPGRGRRGPLREPLPGRRPHRPELVERNSFPSRPTRRCRKRIGRPSVSSVAMRGDEHDRRGEDDRQPGEHPVGCVLERELPALRIARAHGDDRDSADPLELEIVGDALEQPRQHRHGDAADLASTQQIELRRVRAGREADDDMRDPKILQDRFEAGAERSRSSSPARVEHRNPRGESISSGSSSRKATGRSPNSGRWTSRSANSRPTTAGADDQRLLPDLAGTATAHLDDVAPAPRSDHVGRGEDPGPNRLCRGVGIVEDQHPSERHAHRDDRGRGDDRPGVLEEMGGERGPIQAEVDEDREDQDAEDRQREGIRAQRCSRRARDRRDCGERQHQSVDAEAAGIEDRRADVPRPATPAQPADEVGGHAPLDRDPPGCSVGDRTGVDR